MLCDTIWQMCLFMHQEVKFSHLILCTGTDGPFPGHNTVVSYQSAIQKYEDFVNEVGS